MPLFGGKHDTTPVQPAPVATNRNSVSSSGSHSIFSRNSRNSASVASSTSDLDRRSSNRHSLTKGSGIFNRNNEDPSIASARERVQRAERAEQEADRALTAARASVRSAKEHVHQLELEAKEDARLAKIKQQQAGEIGKRARPLGRHG